MAAKAKKKTKKRAVAVERRRSARLKVVESFQIFLMIPTLGDRRIELKDISDTGIGFEADFAGRLESGKPTKCFLYLNPSLKLPLTFKIVHFRVLRNKGVRIGCELTDTKSKAFKTYQKFVRMFDELSEYVK